MALRCPVCGQELEDEEDLRAHEHELPSAWQETGAGFACPTCGAEFDDEEALISHEATVHLGPRGKARRQRSRIGPTGPRDHRPPRHWPQG